MIPRDDDDEMRLFQCRCGVVTDGARCGYCEADAVEKRALDMLAVVPTLRSRERETHQLVFDAYGTCDAEQLRAVFERRRGGDPKARWPLA